MKYDWIGWLATIVFMTSYVPKSPVVLRRIQAVSSCLWLTYGLYIHSTPTVVANAIVALFAVYSSIFSNAVKSSRPV